MSGFGHYDQTAQALEREIRRYGIAIGLDWSDSARLRTLAREALSCTSECRIGLLRHPDYMERHKGELFALSELMLVTMRQSAQIGVHTHGGAAWKAFGRALYEEAERARGAGEGMSRG
ncbi:hypothetical protein [Thauera chlorobenzoica]|uniref:Uncharacterized protein n=1 Tax=Thauera chlorobenzoica TaxID=96773 RepID=A0A1H5ULL3_9RHOO|nr:hypothetical protein [Thauera chlorobenzoica]APR03593.1 hypothetical protein Tchl_0729 [Thauera chlorobenzoica]SEF75318.1 hypothetical protein SAMN05216242_10551 [Thauera chlorobenzoica]